MSYFIYLFIYLFILRETNQNTVCDLQVQLDQLTNQINVIDYTDSQEVCKQFSFIELCHFFVELSILRVINPNSRPSEIFNVRARIFVRVNTDRVHVRWRFCAAYSYDPSDHTDRRWGLGT